MQPTQSIAIDHYRAYKPRAYVQAGSEQATILFGGLHWRAERLIQGAAARFGYNTEVLPTATRADLLAGRELADIGQCCPTSFTTGSLANFLQGKARELGAQAVADNYVHVTAGSCGSCRFGQYHQSYELALRNLNMESFRLFLLQQNRLDQSEVNNSGLEFSPQMMTGVFWAVLVADILQDLEYQIRPYEVNAGETDRVARQSMEQLYETFRDAPAKGGGKSGVLWYLLTPHFTRALREVFKRYAAIEVDRLRVKPLVKITGEFYLQTVEGDPNYNIHRWLESEQAEVYPAAITIWVDYLMRLAAQELEDRIGVRSGARSSLALLNAGRWLLRKNYDKMRDALGGLPREMPRQEELRRLATPYYHSRLNGGEGDMLVGKALWAHSRKKAHMICELSPYACMPNTMSVGAMAAALGDHPDLLYAPLEIKGDAEVHALSRCQMILSEAKKRAQNEFEQVLERTNLTAESARELLERHPRARLAGYRVPHAGAAGTAANLVLHLASIR